jgi:GT2 family glycosyltransferase
MISIIVCHRSPVFLNQFKTSVTQTAGVEHEIIVVDNKENSYNIFEAYNEGIRKSTFSILCFVHEDVRFHTKDWGVNLINHFKDKTIGLVGTVGGNALPCCPAHWHGNLTLNEEYCNLIQHSPSKKTPDDVTGGSRHDFINPSNKNVIDTVTVDGLFFAIRKDFFTNGNSFDEKTFDGFHCYDIDMCLQVLNANLRVVVVFDILLEHFSLGSRNENWAVSSEKLADKWEHMLPVYKKSIPDKKIVSLHHYRALLTYCYLVQDFFSDRKIRNIIKKYWYKTPFLFNKTSLYLWLWMKLGYKPLRYPYRILKFLFG